VARRVEGLAHGPDGLEPEPGERGVEPRPQHRDALGPRVVLEVWRHVGERAPQVVKQWEDRLEHAAPDAIGVRGALFRDPALEVAEVGSLPAQLVEELVRRRSGRPIALGSIVLARIGHRAPPLLAGGPPPRSGRSTTCRTSLFDAGRETTR
jgi:hypothetical protein